MTDKFPSTIELCNCDCHTGDGFFTPMRWMVQTRVPDDIVSQYLCTDCLLTLVSEDIGTSITIVRMR